MLNQSQVCRSWNLSLKTCFLFCRPLSGLYPIVGWKIGSDVTYLAEGNAADTGTAIQWAQELGEEPCVNWSIKDNPKHNPRFSDRLIIVTHTALLIHQTVETECCFMHIFFKYRKWFTLKYVQTNTDTELSSEKLIRYGDNWNLGDIVRLL